MKLIIDELEERISKAMESVAAVRLCAAVVRPAADAKFGDYQANGVMALAKQVKTNPRKLAEEIVANLDLSDMCEPPEVAGPGFINLRLKADFLAARLLEINGDADRLAVDKAAGRKTIVVDFSSPNIAKQMHVGHLRSTIIGDAICRMLEFLGHNVIPQNHIGDWGTQFGMVILGLWHVCMAEEKYAGQEPYYRTELEEMKAHATDRKTLEDICRRIRKRQEEDWREDSYESTGDGKKLFRPFLDKLPTRDESVLWGKILSAYQYMNMLEETIAGMGLRNPTLVDGKVQDIPFELLSRHVTAMLQKGGKQNQQECDAWAHVRRLTMKQCNEIYRLLNVTLNDSHVRGESAYNDDLPGVVADLKKAGLAGESDGAVCVFPEGFKNKEGQPLPFIIQKSDGAYLYATTDLAALRYRVYKLKADAIVYVTDSRQKLHFEMLFAVARAACWAGEDTELTHVMFGSVLGEDGAPLKTRSGENVKLRELLDEAVERARAVVEQKNPELSEADKVKIAEAVGIGAVKYADYSNNRTSDYVFSFDKMLAMEGNTAPYMQYAYARIKSIERKAESKDVDIETELASVKELTLADAAELDLAKHLIRYGEAVAAAAADYRPNYLTSYLFELAQKFSAFYTNCPVLSAEPAKRPTRLLLCDLTARTIKHGLGELLGITVVEQM
ncbi:MAG: arginine--tRNA ligase [Sedimentisphaerales bacterium]|nr:arginine--tRNA ligase [Sedimentisphaerales bacterium]